MNALDRHMPPHHNPDSSDRNAGELRRLARRVELRSSDRATFERAIEDAKAGHSSAAWPPARPSAVGPRSSAQAIRPPQEDAHGLSEWALLNQTSAGTHSGGMHEHDRLEPATGRDGGTAIGQEGCVDRVPAAATNAADAAREAHAPPAARDDQLGRFLAPAQTEGRWTFELTGGDLPVREFSLDRQRFAPTQVTLHMQDLLETRLQPPLQRLRERLAEMGASLAHVRHDDAAAGSGQHTVEDEA